MAMNKRKTTTAIVAGVTALALLLGGTFAWTSISQQARNEAIVDINPGGRLHDDFNGKNKDVYVENFGDDITGVPIYARIRLDQYFEVGQEAGKNKTTAMADRNVEAKIGGDINNTTTWVTYIPGDGDLNDTSAVPANGNWSWNLGNETDKPIYLPTFNMNKDSLAADINGTYEGTTEGDIVHYDDYKTYTDQQAVSGTEVFDWDDEDNVEESNPTITKDNTTPRDDADVYHNEDQEHIAKPISTTAEVMSMAQWIENGSQPGNYWVYDTDGWAYWANAIQPGETTGLLLDSINMTKVPDDNYYYGINVVAQFATAGDISEFNAGEPGSDQTWTAEAEELFAKIANVEAVTITIENIDDEYRIGAGNNATFSATRTIAGVAAESQPTFTWTATDAKDAAIEGVSINNSGHLTVDETVPDGTEITVTASSGELKGSAVLTVVGTVNFTATYNGTDLGTYTAEYDEDGNYYSSGGLVDNVENDKVVYVFDNIEVDWDKTLATDYSLYGITLAKTENDALEVSLSGDAFNTSSIGWNNSLGTNTQYMRISVYTTNGKRVLVSINEKTREEPSIQMTYIRGNAEPQTIDDDTVLQTGDILVMSVGEDIVAEKSGTRYFFKEGFEYTTQEIMKLTDVKSQGDNTLRYQVTVLDGVTTEQSVMIRFYPQFKYGDDHFARLVKHEINVKVAPNTTAE